ncbi:hypothetical protein FKW77_004215 [Venturia effusa]|uniref:Uncharacterized protein n=1 Tax=Venturia effusa TaxID=50376 RepID=A0A517L767_9PEZI|nr:hypothetical protein FKW77_004215 [Venturia effusa]
MIGKLQVWRGERGEHKKEAQERSRVGTPVSCDDSDRRSKDAPPIKALPLIAPAKKRAPRPRLSIGRRSFSLGPSKPGEDLFLAQSASQDLSLFSNIPAASGARGDRPSSALDFRHSLPRPQTADLDHSLYRIRSRNAPPVSASSDRSRSPWTDKPLPLTIDSDQAREPSSSTSSPQPSIQTIQNDSRASYGAAVSRPKTSSSVDPPHRPRGPPATPSYSLTPTITPQHSRRPSTNSVKNNRASRDTTNKRNSGASTHGFGPGTRTSSSSRTSITTQTTPKASGLKSPIEQGMNLDEVEGSLNATITELQELQIGFGEDHSNNPATAQRTRRAESPNSAPANQGYFTRGSQFPSTSTSSSLPPTPIVAISDEDDNQIHSTDSTYHKQNRDLHTALVENDTLKKQLSLLQTRLANIDTIRIERDQFEELYKEYQAHLQESVKHGQTLIDKLKLSRGNEEASRNNVSELNHRLEEANMHRLDALHRHHELEDEHRLIEQKHKVLQEERERVEQKRLSFEADKSVLRLEIAKLPALHQEIAILRQRPQQSALDELQNKLKAAEERARKLEQQLGSGKADLPSIIADLAFKLEDLQRGLTDKDRRMEELEAANKVLSKNAKADTNHANRVRRLERTIAEQHKTFRTVQAERDQLRQLIHTEFRRTANEVQKRQHPATALLEKKPDIDAAIMEVRKRAQEFLRSQKRREENLLATRAVRIEELQQEIDYHVKDIVLYKLDVKGYKKDLKRAQTKLARLEEIHPHRNGLVSQYSSKDSNTTRPSISSRDSENSIAQAVGAVTNDHDVLSTDEEDSPSGQRQEERLASIYYSPDGSPVSSPKKEKRGSNLLGR